jgi:hypothetical protein
MQFQQEAKRSNQSLADVSESNREGEQWLIPDFIRSVKYIASKITKKDGKAPK